MKKLPLLFLCLIILLGGCKAEPAFPLDKFKGKFTAFEKDVKLKGEIISDSNNCMALKLSSPESMRGYIYKYTDDKLSIHYCNMNIDCEVDYLPKGAFSQVIFSVIKSIKKEENCVLTGSYNSFAEYKGNCNSGEYRIKSDIINGFIKEISLKEIKIKFNNLSYIK